MNELRSYPSTPHGRQDPQLSDKQLIPWVSTDLLLNLLKVKNVEGVKAEWDATPEAI